MEKIRFAKKRDRGERRREKTKETESNTSVGRTTRERGRELRWCHRSSGTRAYAFLSSCRFFAFIACAPSSLAPSRSILSCWGKSSFSSSLCLFYHSRLSLSDSLSFRSPDSTIARERAERYNVPKTHSASIPVHVAGIYRLCRWSLNLLGNPAARKNVVFVFSLLSSCLMLRSRTLSLLFLCPFIFTLSPPTSSSVSCSFSLRLPFLLSQSPSRLLLSPVLCGRQSALL